MSDLEDVQRDERKARRRAELHAKYDSEALARGERLFGESFLGMLDLHDSVDDEWTHAWLGYVYRYMYGRTVIDEQTRALIIIGQHIAAGHYAELRLHMTSAIKLGVDPQKILEVCLHAPLYVGMPTLRHSLGAFRSVMVEQGLATYDEPPFEYLKTGQGSE